MDAVDGVAVLGVVGVWEKVGFDDIPIDANISSSSVGLGLGGCFLTIGFLAPKLVIPIGIEPGIPMGIPPATILFG